MAPIGFITILVVSLVVAICVDSLFDAVPNTLGVSVGSLFAGGVDMRLLSSALQLWWFYIGGCWVVPQSPMSSMFGI